jgi:hypothetical protein
VSTTTTTCAAIRELRLHVAGLDAAAPACLHATRLNDAVTAAEQVHLQAAARYNPPPQAGDPLPPPLAGEADLVAATPPATASHPEPRRAPFPPGSAAAGSVLLCSPCTSPATVCHQPTTSPDSSTREGLPTSCTAASRMRRRCSRVQNCRRPLMRSRGKGEIGLGIRY